MLGRRRPRRNPLGYGCKGGTGPNTGRKSVTYRVVLPDGTEVRKRSMKVDQPVATAMIYGEPGDWAVAAITSEPQSWPGQVPVEATRI